jgi:predicted Rossmann-fold nucleotide-binding protein
MITWNQLGLVAVPVVFLDVAGYFDPLFEFIDASVAAGFVSAANAALARRASTVETALGLALSTPDAYAPKWLG